MTRPRKPEARVFFEDEIIVDSFAGGGGASKGIEMALGRSGRPVHLTHYRRPTVPPAEIPPRG